MYIYRVIRVQLINTTMKISKEDIKNAVLILSKYVNREDSYRVLIKEVTLPELTKMIIYDLFCIQNEDRLFENEEEHFNAISLIREYCLELRSVGFVIFENTVFTNIGGYGGYDTYIKISKNKLLDFFENNGYILKGICLENIRDWGDEKLTEFELVSNIYIIGNNNYVKVLDFFNNFDFIESAKIDVDNTFTINFKPGIGVEWS